MDATSRVQTGRTMRARIARRLAAGTGAVLLVGTAAGIGTAAGQAPAGQSVWDAVYSKEQSRRGQELSKAGCVVCHGEGLAGSDLGPPLLGTDFISLWTGRSVGELYEKIHTTMPADAAGTLKPQQSADLTAYILELNDFPAGSNELGSEMAALNQIKISRAK
jgi:mono/diheme cytochrome c family protein